MVPQKDACPTQTFALIKHFSFFCLPFVPQNFPRKSSMAEWSHLPKELLDLIAHHLDGPFSVMRFRSVCSSWRSSVSPKRCSLPGGFPFLPNYGISDSSWGFQLSKRSIFQIRSPITCVHTNPDCWLIKIEEDLPGRMQLLNPLSRLPIKPLPEEFPKVLNTLDFQVFELGQEYVLHYLNYWPLRNYPGDVSNLYMEKVVFMYFDSDKSDFALLTIHVSGKLAMFKSGDKKWTVIPHMQSPYDDVIIFKRDFYAVDNTGRTVLVGLNDDVSLIAEPVFGGDKKIMAESNGELLLVDVYLSMVAEGDLHASTEPHDGLLSEKTVRFKVFKLVGEEEKEWVEMNNLGDRMLFLADNCAFSASGCKGNCIFFTDNYFITDLEEEDYVFESSDIGVFDLDNGSTAPLSDYPEYVKLFWPPPDWITSATSSVQRHFKELTLGIGN